jgi:hypothetical protein
LPGTVGSAGCGKLAGVARDVGWVDIGCGVAGGGGRVGRGCVAEIWECAPVL